VHAVKALRTGGSWEQKRKWNVYIHVYLCMLHQHQTQFYKFSQFLLQLIEMTTMGSGLVLVCLYIYDDDDVSTETISSFLLK